MTISAERLGEPKKFSFSEVHAMSVAEVMRRINEGEALRQKVEEAREAIGYAIEYFDSEADYQQHHGTDDDAALESGYALALRRLLEG